MDWFLRPDKWPVTPGDWWRAADELARSPTRVLLDLFETVTGALVGKDLDLRSGRGTVSLHLESVAGAHSAPPVALGALRPGLDLEGLEVVEVRARDVRLDAGRIDRLELTAQHVHLEGGLTTHLVAGPIDLVGEVDQATVDEWLADHDAPVTVELDGTDRATVRVNRWVRAVVSAELEGDTVTVPVHAVKVGAVSVPFAHRFVEARTLTIPRFAPDLRVTGLSSTPGTVRVTAVVDEFREPLALEQVLRSGSQVGSHVVINRAGEDAPR